jgi:hypothetical protein
MTTEQQPTDATPKPRYAQPRTHLHWGKNDRLKVLKMLAWVIYDREHIRNADALARRVATLCEPVMQSVLGEAGVTLDAIKEHTLAEQGSAITAAKLLQRADKTERYSELNDFADAVLQAYDFLDANTYGGIS